MIPRLELRRWLADAEAQNATADRLVEVGRQLKALPFIERLRREVDALPSSDAAAVLGCAQCAMADPDGLAGMFSCLIDAAATDPYFRPALRNLTSAIHSGILLFETPVLSLFVSVLPADSLAAKRRGRDGARSIV